MNSILFEGSEIVLQHKINQNSTIQWHPRWKATTEIHLTRKIALWASKITPGRPPGASKHPQELPIDAPNSPMTAPERPQDGPKTPPQTHFRRQDGPRGPQEPHSTPPDLDFGAF